LVIAYVLDYQHIKKGMPLFEKGGISQKKFRSAGAVPQAAHCPLKRADSVGKPASRP